MCTVRYAGVFLEDPLAVPWPGDRAPGRAPRH
ncbi:hypothetical protein NX801_04745 [Streptomyces sp. LP05-1]|uniref:Uncharacterized protein n=1 Tax=Streptomyces pyxinae TaxID=2970734 RepID=A0ABT2CC45_9ACTN|nr:hypothetical protein [Streptomyces sp. LP05-1]MCS0634978.1 hypothetical protein [Streptomyces sp. LP05-1]